MLPHIGQRIAFFEVYRARVTAKYNDIKSVRLTLALSTCPLFIHPCYISGGLAKDILPKNRRVVCPKP